MAYLKAFAEREHVTAAQFTAIGAFAGATLGYFDWTTKEYRRNAVDEQVEVASLTGDIALGPDGNPALHIHCRRAFVLISNRTVRLRPSVRFSIRGSVLC